MTEKEGAAELSIECREDEDEEEELLVTQQCRSTEQISLDSLWQDKSFGLNPR